MKLLLTLTVLAVVVVASLAAPPAVIELTESESDVKPDGGYKFSYKQSDGQTRTEEGTIINPGTENEAIVITGTFSWVGPDDVTYSLSFTADQDGFKPVGDHLPA